jgi:type IV fimbrial biogenesis protein FimT
MKRPHPACSLRTCSGTLSRSNPARACGSQRGFTLIELAVGLAIISVLLSVGLPRITDNQAIRQTEGLSERVAGALRRAREQALQHNTPVQFSLVDTLNSDCALDNSGPHIVISGKSPVARCDAAASDSREPFIVQVLPQEQNSRKVLVSADDGNGNPRSRVVFDSLGRVVTTGNDWIRHIDLVAASDRGKQLRIQVAASGAVRTCDRSIAEVGDPRRC